MKQQTCDEIAQMFPLLAINFPTLETHYNIPRLLSWANFAFRAISTSTALFRHIYLRLAQK